MPQPSEFSPELLPPAHLAPAYRAALIAGAWLNGIMFFAEGAIGLAIGSAALIADAVDFLEDAGMYSLAVVAIAWSARNRALAGLVMSGAMFGVGLVAVWQVVERIIGGGAPSAPPMAATAAVALAVNVYCAWRLAPHRRGDAGVRSVWLSTRNDAILNALTIAAAGLVGLTATAWPDLAAGVVIAAINMSAAIGIARLARVELREKGRSARRVPR